MECPDLKLWRVKSLKETEQGFHLCVYGLMITGALWTVFFSKTLS